MRILWLTWKDRMHPTAGGAERISSELAARLARDGHDVIVLTSSVRGRPARERIDGYEVIRAGNRVSVYPRAIWHAVHHLADWPDLVVEEINTIPFFARLAGRRLRGRRTLLFYQLCREVWFFELPRPLGAIGYRAEPVYLRLLTGDPVLALSESTRQDLIRHGFDGGAISILGAAISMEPSPTLDAVAKFDRPTLVSLGSVRPMKRTLDQLRAFELAKRDIPGLALIVAGETDSAYGRHFREAIAASPFRADIEYVGRVDEASKRALIARAHAILVTSVKEGWGLIVTEAASQGTPAVVYDVDGLRDSVVGERTGLVVPANPTALAAGVVRLLGDATLYERLRDAGWRWSQELTFDALYARFTRLVLAPGD